MPYCIVFRLNSSHFGGRVDLLGEVLLSLKVEVNSGGIYALGDPWGLRVPSFSAASAFALCCLDAPLWLMVSGQAPGYPTPRG